MYTLYDYYRSSACYRVRIALYLKEIPYEQVPIHLVQNQQHAQDYKQINPQGLVPALFLPESNQVLTQSMAIIEYLEETVKTSPLLPTDLIARAKVRAMANMVTCDIHPLNNLRVLNYLKDELDVDDKEKMIWYFHWIKLGFDAIETCLQTQPHGPFCFGQSPTLADVCLIPQVYNAKRFAFNLDNYPLISNIDKQATKHPAFMKALPENQPDAHAT